MKKSLKVGIRLFFASLVLFLTGGSAPGMILAAAIMMLPNWKASRTILAVGSAEDEQKALLEKITGDVKKLIADANKENAKESDVNKLIEKLNKSIADLTEDQKKALKDKCDELAKTNEALTKAVADANEALNKQGIELKKLMDNAPTKEDKKSIIKNFRSAIKDAITKAATEGKFLEDIKDPVYGDRMSFSKFFEKNPNGKISIKIENFGVEGVNKVAVDMLESNIVQSNVSALRLTELDPRRVGIPLTIYPHVTDVFPTKRLTRPNMALLVVYSYEDGSGTKTEGSASSKSSFLFKTVSFPSFFIATYFTLSDETLDDLEEALDEISIVAPDKILDKIDSKILSANGDDSTDIKGLFHTDKSTAFSTTPYLASIEGANFVDVVACMKRTVESAKYRPNVVYLNPTDVLKLAAAKNTFEDSRIDRRVVFDAIGNPTMLYGLRIIQSEQIAANEACVMDINQTMIGRRLDMVMEIGYNGTDLTEGQKTVVIKIRLAFGVRDKSAIVYESDVAAAIVDINATS